MFRFNRRKRLQLLLGLLMIAAMAGAIFYRVSTTRASYLLRQGREALKQGNGDKAAQLVERLSEQGYEPQTRLLLGETLVCEGRADLQRAEELQAGDPKKSAAWRGRADDAFRRALKELSRVRDEGPLATEAAILGAECLVRLGELPVAADALRQVVDRQPDHKEAHRWLAAIAIDMNNAKDAIEHLRAWGRLDPKEGRPYRWVGFFLLNDYHNPRDAVEAYQEAMRRTLPAEDQFAVIKEWADALIGPQGDYQGALEVLDQCPEAYRQSPDILMRRAQALRSLGQDAEAVRLTEEALRANPDLIEALLLRARLYRESEQPKSALPLLQRAVQLSPYDTVVRQNLMDTYRETDNNERAEKERLLLEESTAYQKKLSELHEVIMAKPFDDRPRYELGALLLKLNRPAEARTWLRAALSCNPQNAKARQDLEKLAETNGP
jgi:tetratricopeptide (TPR) repeat protein